MGIYFRLSSVGTKFNILRELTILSRVRNPEAMEPTMGDTSQNVRPTDDSITTALAGGGTRTVRIPTRTETLMYQQSTAHPSGGHIAAAHCTLHTARAVGTTEEPGQTVTVDHRPDHASRR